MKELAPNNFAHHYERAMNEWLTWEQHVEVDTTWRAVEAVRPNMWVMFLPRDITDGANLAPVIAKVIGMREEKGHITLTTTQGVMVLSRGDKIQAVL